MPKRTTRPKPRQPKGAGVEPGRSSRKARRAAEERRRQRVRRAGLAAVAGVVVIVGVMVAVAITRSGETAQNPQGAGRAGALVQHVPVSVLGAVGAGQGVAQPKPLPPNTPPLEQDGKTEVLYVGAEYCPYCAAERWPMIVALSRFGTFSNLGATESSASDVFPRTPTFTFHGATYTSDVLAFVAVETNTNQPAPGGGYTPLERPTAAEQELIQRYDRAPYTTQTGAIPFGMIGNRYVSIGATYDPSVLQGMTRDQIAAALSDPQSPVAQSVDGAANTFTAAICRATNGKPSSVCADPVINRIIQSLPTS